MRTYPKELLSSLFETLLLSEPFRDRLDDSLEEGRGLGLLDSSVRGTGLHLGVRIEEDDDVEHTDNVSGLG